MVVLKKKRYIYIYFLTLYLKKYTAADVHGTLIPILQSFRDRVTYLNCAVQNDHLANIPSSVDVVVKSSNDKNRDKNSSRRFVNYCIIRKGMTIAKLFNALNIPQFVKFCVSLIQISTK